MQAPIKDDLRRVGTWLAVLAALQCLLVLIEVPASWRGFAGYLPLHNALETASIVVAGLVFTVGWTARPSTTPLALVVLACAFLGVAVLDFSHMLSFKGMPAYVTESDPEKAINFWLAARLLAAAALLWAVAVPWGWMASARRRMAVMALVVLTVAVAHWLFLYHPQQLPRTFVAGEGLTDFKVGFEYFIIALHAGAAALLLWRMRRLQGFNAPWLLGAVVVMGMGEIFFTLYANVTDVFNVMGHVYKVIAYLFLYRAVYVHAVQRPYQELDAAQSNLKATLAAIPDLVFEMSVTGDYLSYYSPVSSELLAQPADTLSLRNVRNVLPASAAEVVLAALQKAHTTGHASGYLMALDLPQGKCWFELSGSRKVMPAGEPDRIVLMSRDVTQRYQSEQQLRLLGTAVANLNDIVLITEAEPFDAPGPRIVFVNDAFVRCTGYSREEVLGKSPRILQGPRSSREELDRIRQALQTWQPVHAQLINYTKSREEFWVELDIKPLADERGWYTHWVAVQRDVTDRVRAREALRGAVLHTQAILENMADGVITAGQDGRIRSFSKAACQIFGYSPQEVIGQNLSLLMPEPHAHQHDSYMEVHKRTGENRLLGKPRELEGKRRDGSVFPMSLAVTKTEHQGEVTYIGLVRDITQRRMDEEEIRRLAFYDGLTGLPNRRLLVDHLQHALVAAQRSGLFGALVFMDLDHFKQVNDTLGHPVGDELLQQVGTRLQCTMRESDTVSRLGGDEFVLVLENLSRNPEEAAGRVESAASKVLYAMSQPYTLQGRQMVCTASLGIVMFGQDKASLDDLMKEADAALYQAKAAGRNTFCFFDPEMQAAAVARSALEEDLRRGIDANELILFYQVQVDRATHCVTGVEALVRWSHPTRGMVSPGEFIPLAEETGLMLPMGLWVLQHACSQLAQWAHSPATSALTMAVNVSAQQFAQDSFVADVTLALQRTGARPDLLKLELTESALVANVEEIVQKMNALRALGVRFSLDDFGTGYSSLSYLKRLPLYQLKIDQSFVRDLLTDPNDASIASTVIALGHSLGLQVIAEGVESQGHRDALERMGCDHFQGYFFGRPVPQDVLLTQLAQLAQAPLALEVAAQPTAA